MIGPDDIRRCGEALYGPRWTTDLARDLGVSYRTLRRWMAGTRSIPPGIEDELTSICERRGRMLIAMARQCSRRT